MAGDMSESLACYYEHVNRLEYAMKNSELYRLQRQEELTRMLDESPRTRVRDYLRSVPFNCGIGFKSNGGPGLLNSSIQLKSAQSDQGLPLHLPIGLSDTTNVYVPPQQAFSQLNLSNHPSNAYSPVPGMFCNGIGCRYQGTSRRGNSVDKLTEAHRRLFVKTSELLKETESFRKVITKSHSDQGTQTDEESVIIEQCKSPSRYNPPVHAVAVRNIETTTSRIPQDTMMSVGVDNSSFILTQNSESAGCSYCFHCAQNRMRKHSESQRSEAGVSVVNKPIIGLPNLTEMTKFNCASAQGEKSHKSPEGKEPTRTVEMMHKIKNKYVSNKNNSDVANSLKLKSPLTFDPTSEVAEPEDLQPDPAPTSAVYFNNTHEASTLGKKVAYYNTGSNIGRGKIDHGANCKTMAIQPVKAAGQTNGSTRNIQRLDESPQHIVNECNGTESEGEISEGEVENRRSSDNSYPLEGVDNGGETSVLETTSASDISHDGMEEGEKVEVEIDEFEDYEEYLKHQGEPAAITNELPAETATTMASDEAHFMASEGAHFLASEEAHLMASDEAHFMVSDEAHLPASNQIVQSGVTQLGSETFQELTVLFGCVEKLSSGASGYSDAYSGEVADDELWVSVKEEVFACEDASQLQLDDVCRTALAQLVKIVYNLPDGSLFTDNMLQRGTSLSDEEIRIELNRELHRLRCWDIVSNHIAYIQRHNIMDIQTVVSIFTPLLLPFNASREQLEACEQLLMQQFPMSNDSVDKISGMDEASGSSDSVSRRIEAATRQTASTKERAGEPDIQQEAQKGNGSMSSRSELNAEDENLESDELESYSSGGSGEQVQEAVAGEMKEAATMDITTSKSMGEKTEEGECLEDKLLRELCETDEDDSGGDSNGFPDKPDQPLPDNTGSRWAPVKLTAVTPVSRDDQQRSASKKSGHTNSASLHSAKANETKRFYLANTKSQASMNEVVTKQMGSVLLQPKKEKAKVKGKKPIWLASSSSEDDLGGLDIKFPKKPPLVRQHSRKSSSELEEF